MNDIGKIGLIIGIIGGIGLGLMLGSEFSGRYVTLIGTDFNSCNCCPISSS